MRTLSSLIPALLIVLIAGCNTVNNSSSSFIDDSVKGPYTHIEGTVLHLDLEGGFWAINGEDGTTYEPTNFPEGFQKNGLKISAEVKVHHDRMSFRMVGPIISIHRMDSH